MLKIKKQNINYDIEYELENGVFLFAMDWNGEEYDGSIDIGRKGYKSNNKRYIPVYEEYEDDFEIIGFEER